MGNSPFKVKNFALGLFKSESEKEFTLADVLKSDMTPESISHSGHLRN